MYVYSLQFFPEGGVEGHLPFDRGVPLLQRVHWEICCRNQNQFKRSKQNILVHDCEGGGASPNGGAGGVTVIANDAA